MRTMFLDLSAKPGPGGVKTAQDILLEKDHLAAIIKSVPLMGLDAPFEATAGDLDACPGITDADGMEVLYGDIVAALNAIAKLQKVLQEEAAR